jgi:hypothetical protein
MPKLSDTKSEASKENKLGHEAIALKAGGEPLPPGPGEPAPQLDPEEFIGKTSATEGSPNTGDQFRFWLRRGVLINPFDFVAVEHEGGSTTIGVVREMRLITDAMSHLSNFVSSNFGDIAEAPNTLRVGTTVVTAGVMSNSGVPLADRPDQVEVGLPLGSDKPVRFATADEVERALGISSMKNPIPAGIIEMSNGTQVPVMVNGDYLLGPEGAHINASGTSGLATKTSFLMFLLQAVYSRIPDKVAIVLFNVKQHDLLHVDQSPRDLSARDHRIYSALGIRPTELPKNSVKYFLPHGHDGPNSEFKPDSYDQYAYEFADAKDKLNLLFSEIDDPQSTIESIVEHIRDQTDLISKKDVADAAGTIILNSGQKVQTWIQLRHYDSFPEDVVTHRYSLFRFRRHLSRMTKGNPLFPKARGECVNLGDRIKEIKAGDVYVIDMARITKPEEQAFIVGDVMASIDELYVSGEEEPPKNIIVLIDELNRYCPAKQTPSSVAEQIIEIARTGRSRGVVLFGAQQFKSAVNNQVNDNCATHVIGRTGTQELSSTAYRFLDDLTKTSVSHLGKGELVLAHPLFRQPVRIVFPRPAYRRQEVS